MPDGARSFYTDMKYGDAYYSSIVRDVMESALALPARKARKEFHRGAVDGRLRRAENSAEKSRRFLRRDLLFGVLNIAKSAVEVTWDRDFTLIWGEDYKSALPGSDDDLFYLTDNIKAKSRASSSPAETATSCSGRTAIFMST